MSKVQTTLGGWSLYQALTASDKMVFDEALSGFVGVVYTPQSVSTQIVTGTNYRFKCAASIPPSEVIWEAILEIYQPLEGKPYIMGIQRI